MTCQRLHAADCLQRRLTVVPFQRGSAHGPKAASSCGVLANLSVASDSVNNTSKLLVAREAKINGKATRRFEVLSTESLATDKFASTPQLLAAFGPWADPRWKRTTVSLR